MDKLTTLRSLRVRLRELRQAGKSVGLVPTMGSLHEGHLSLIRRARQECGTVILTSFVNPLLFSDSALRDAFPKDSVGDERKAAEAGADIFFLPDDSEIFAENAATRVVVSGNLTEVLEGRFNPSYFEGYTTVLTKFLACSQPDRLYLSEKSWQQIKVSERLIADLGFGTQVVACPPIREQDGLAVSRESIALSDDDRKKARVLPYLLATAQDLLDSAMPETQTDKGGVIVHWLASLLQTNQPEIVCDYIAVVDPETFEPVDEIKERALVTIALRIGETRLTDSRILRKR